MDALDVIAPVMTLIFFMAFVGLAVLCVFPRQTVRTINTLRDLFDPNYEAPKPKPAQPAVKKPQFYDQFKH
ncbi:hypothetical protein ACP26L_36575 (plasmid) [Paenibacillus sp. S-38]|uniref:hypothetical protein n=1 Tax=Paenibacillus sp. S-38 TaxID=3416710 RepID=UPI003CEEBCB4